MTAQVIDIEVNRPSCRMYYGNVPGATDLDKIKWGQRQIGFRVSGTISAIAQQP